MNTESKMKSLERLMDKVHITLIFDDFGVMAVDCSSVEMYESVKKATEKPISPDRGFALTAPYYSEKLVNELYTQLMAIYSERVAVISQGKKNEKVELLGQDYLDSVIDLLTQKQNKSGD